MSFIDKITWENPHPEIWRDKETQYPDCELGYFRCDYDGYRWWNTVWPSHNELNTYELVKEFDSLYDEFLETFPTRDAMSAYCKTHAKPTSDATEFNAYVELEYGFYWLRMITRKGDYNLYLHGFSKAAMGN